MADSEGLDENIQPLKIQRDSSPVRASGWGRRSQICRKAAFSGSSSCEALRQARALMNSDLPNFTVLPTGMSKVWVRADSLSMVRSLTVLRSSIWRLRLPSPKIAAAASSSGVGGAASGAGAVPSTLVTLSSERNSSALSCCSSVCASVVPAVSKNAARPSVATACFIVIRVRQKRWQVRAVPRVRPMQVCRCLFYRLWSG